MTTNNTDGTNDWQQIIDTTKMYKCEPSDCLHKSCPSCNGTGRNIITGAACIHMISCPCNKCSFVC